MKTTWLLADAGSTKTEWSLWKGDSKVSTFQTQGINPYTQAKEQIENILKSELMPHVRENHVNTVFFYGAGCSSTVQVSIVKTVLTGKFPYADITIEHDLKGAAHGLFGTEPGIVMILGTGSNSCVWSGKEIIAEVPNLGYILGDEGSGSYLGKILVRDFIYDNMPSQISEYLSDTLELTRTEILSRVYKSPNPNRWLAALVLVLSHFKHEEYTQKVISASFDDFFRYNISRYKKYRDHSYSAAMTLGSVGSVGFYFKDELNVVAKNYGFQLEKILKSPMAGLEQFCLSQITPCPNE